jgi:predicted amino acid racemase
MFLKTVLERNKPLVDAALSLHEKGILWPDTYVIDYDQTMENARLILEKAKSMNIELYFMLKQLGRNPLLAQGFMELGYKGAVVVDYREALIMMQHNIPLGNVGHLVQTPKALLKRIIDYKTEVMTVFSFEKLEEIHEAAKELGVIQDVILKVYSEGDMQYPAQEGGIDLEQLVSFVTKTKALNHINIVGATAFPAFLYDKESDDIIETHNYQTILKAIDIMRDLGCEIKQINAPSTTSVRTLDLMRGSLVTHGEPGHGLSGTTPMHAYKECEEVPSVVYLSEISHTFNNMSYAYGGGYYRRSHVKKAYCDQRIVDVIKPDPESIDYYFQLKDVLPMSAGVIMAFRFQIFVTRSYVAVVKGIKTNNIEVVGIYDSLGKKEFE